MTKILAINGSYRDDGVTDKTVEILIQELLSTGAEVENINLRDYPIRVLPELPRVHATNW